MVSEPFPARMAVWPAVFVWPSTVNWVTAKVVPVSTSESFVRTLPVAALSSATVTLSSVVTGASLTAVVVSVRVAVEVATPSVSV